MASSVLRVNELFNRLIITANPPHPKTYCNTFTYLHCFQMYRTHADIV